MPKKNKKKRTKKTTDPPIDRSNVVHVEFLNQQKHMYTEASDYFVRETNDTERALCAQLMLIDTVLLTGTLVAISNKDLLDITSSSVLVVIVSALMLLLLSIGFGISYYFAIIRYNKRWAIAKHKAAESFLDKNIKTWEELRRKTNDEQLNIPQELEQTLLRIQILFIGGAALYYVVALFGLLFNVAKIIGIE